MKKEFINPELEVLRFQKRVLLDDSTETVNVSTSSATSSPSLSRGVFDNSVD